MGFEVGRTASNLIELEHPKKRGKLRPKDYNLRGMLEVGRTRSNFDTKSCDGRLSGGTGEKIFEQKDTKVTK